jgi:CubicO group peptidase (beta-lactamase class C family)
MRLLNPPEPDSHVALVDVQAEDAAGAVATSWAVYRPDLNRPLMMTLPQAPRDGWEEAHAFVYETSPNEKIEVYALACRAGGTWTVVIVDAGRATLDKRGAAVGLILGSLRPRDYHRELFAGRAARPLDADRIALLLDFVREMMRRFAVPGIGISLIDGGRVVYQGGLGVKSAGNPAPVDADTLFMAASNTKALTTLLLARLVDEKRVQWDQPVTDIYPDFRLGDPETTRQVLLRHLVCACTGLPRQDFEWLFNFATATPASSLALLGTMQPTSRFGEVFQYSNLMAAAAGYIAGAILYPDRELGAAYDEAMQMRIFAPLGMTHTTFNMAAAMSGNFASPHGDDPEGRVVPARMDNNYSVVPVRPAGGMWTSARELSRYVQMELAEGLLPDGARLVSGDNLRERRAPQIPVGEDATYGMGLIVSKRYGIPVVRHGGGLFGYKSDMIFLPDHGVGAVILTNADSGEDLTYVFGRRLLEVLFDGRPEAAEEAEVAASQRLNALAKWRERLVIPPDEGVIANLAARYTCPDLGGLRIVRRDGAIIFDFGAWHSAVASRRNDDGTTSFISIDPTIAGFNFVVSEHDGKHALIVRDAQHEYLFVEAVPSG